MSNRLLQLNQAKDLWNLALVVISLTNSMTQTHALFLEWFAISEGIMAAVDDMLVFTRDHLFASPSSAACILMGRPANGCTEWKAANDKTMDEVKRQSVKAAD